MAEEEATSRRDAEHAVERRRHHLAAVDEWLAELELEHGPVPPDTLEWAARQPRHDGRLGPAAGADEMEECPA
jgi:hypothetical protein